MSTGAAIQLLQKAIELATQATEEDKNKNYVEALRLYEHTVEYFLEFMKDETLSDTVKEKARLKCSIYLVRAEKLAEYLSETEEMEEKLMKQLKKAVAMKAPNVKWSDVAGLEATIESLQEAVLLPTKFPQDLTGKEKPWTSILFYGPSGTGKSLLAEALATEANGCKFFSVSSTSLVSKWLGESQKLVKYLFELARKDKPSIIFIDQIDSLCSSEKENESDAAKQIKSELLVQIQGVGYDNSGIVVLGSTNIPWDLDPAILQGFEKKIYIGLPEEKARLAILKICLGNTPHLLTEEDFKYLAKNTDRFSGAYISHLVTDAMMQPVRRVQSSTHFCRVRGPTKDDPSVIVDDLLTPCLPSSPEAIEMSWTDIPGDKLLEPPVCMNDMLLSFDNCKPSTKEEDILMLRNFMKKLNQEEFPI